MPRLFILATDENLFHPQFFNTVLERRPSDWTLCGVAMVRSRETVLKSVQYVLRVGGLSASVILAARVLAHLFKRLGGKSPLGTARNVFARHGLDQVEVPNPNAADFVANLRQLEPDVIFCAVPNILRAPILSVPRLACVNRHAGSLPQFRGIEPVFQALRMGEPRVCVTFHTMTTEIDAGVVLWEHEEVVRPRDTVFDLYSRLFSAAGDGFWFALERLQHGQGRPVDVANGNYFSWPTAGEIAEFRARGRRYV